MATDLVLEEQLLAFLKLMQRAEQTASEAMEFARAASSHDPRFQAVLTQTRENYANAVANRVRAEETLRQFYEAKT